MIMLSLQLMVDFNFMIQIISLATVSLLWLVSSTNLPPMCTKASLIVLDDCWIIWITLSLSVVDEDRLFMDFMHLSKYSDILSWRLKFLVAVFFAVTFFFLFLFYPILSHLSTLCHSNSGEVDSQSWIRVPPGGGILIFQFYLLLLKYHHKLSLRHTKFVMNHGAAWFQEDSSLNWFTKLPIRVISSTRWK